MGFAGFFSHFLVVFNVILLTGEACSSTLVCLIRYMSSVYLIGAVRQKVFSIC